MPQTGLLKVSLMIMMAIIIIIINNNIILIIISSIILIIISSIILLIIILYLFNLWHHFLPMAHPSGGPGASELKEKHQQNNHPKAGGRPVHHLSFIVFPNFSTKRIPEKKQFSGARQLIQQFAFLGHCRRMFLYVQHLSLNGGRYELHFQETGCRKIAFFSKSNIQAWPVHLSSVVFFSAFSYDRGP